MRISEVLASILVLVDAAMSSPDHLTRSGLSTAPGHSAPVVHLHELFDNGFDQIVGLDILVE